MRPFKNIIVGHDFNAGGEIAFRSAVALAKRCGAELKVVHVVDRDSGYDRSARSMPEPLASRIREQFAAGAGVDELQASRVEYSVLEGEPSSELIRAGHQCNADLLVIGGITSADKPTLGKTAEAVSQKSSGPVLITKRVLDADSRRFLAPVDFSPTSRGAAELAISLARCFGARVRLFHSIILSHFFAAGPAADAESQDTGQLTQPEPLEEQWQEFLASLPDLDKVEWERHSEHGLAATLIVQEAMKNESDLIIMGTHGRGGSTQRLLGSVTTEVLCNASCSVLTLRPKS